jgi:short-subunit dehydrogenase
VKESPRTILITGASSGIGAELAHHYAAPDVTLILTARDEARLADVKSRCEAKGANVITASIDVREKEKLAEFIARMDDATPIDLVIANAGISTGTFSGEESLAAAEAVFEVNMMGVIHTIHPLIDRMCARGRGQIAIMSSLAGICALPGAAAYSASKAAVRYYGEALHAKLKPHGVYVSVICPGWITTPLTDKNDFAMPFIMSVERASQHIIRNLKQKKPQIIFPLALYGLLRVLQIFPAALRMGALSLMPEKRQKT